MFDRVSLSGVEYPSWTYFPMSSAPPTWVRDFVAVVEANRADVDSSKNNGLNSDAVLAALRPGLLKLGYEVEASKRRDDKIRRPVLFGDQGVERVAYEIDAIHDELGVLVEIEAGRGAMSNAIYRDLIRTSLIVGATYLALGVMLEYRYATSGVTQSYRDTKGLLDAIYASGRLQLPFEGVLLFGY
jgi:hypothetical protein